MHELLNYRYALQYCVFDATGKELWSGRELVISPAEQANHVSISHESWPIPKSAQYPVTVGLRVKDTFISQFVLPDSNCPHVENAFSLAEISAEQAVVKPAAVKPAAGASRHFTLLNDYPDLGCRIYRNERALPAAYIVGQALHRSADDDNTLDFLLNEQDFNPHSTVVLEDGGSDLDNGMENEEAKEIAISRPDCNTVFAECDAANDCYFVLTDAFYPGWKCFVDGQESPIFRANYLFRGLKLSKGHHKIRFQFVPSVYYNSALLALLVLAGVGVWAIVRRKELVAEEEAV